MWEKRYICGVNFEDMENISITTNIVALAYDELQPEQRELVDRAKAMTYKSYAPYSHFRVGAAIRLESGAIVTGSNQENVAYPSGLCAERTACFYAGAEHPDDKFKAIAIAARDTSGEFCAEPIAPCGACRQSLLEYEALAGASVQVILVGRDRIFVLPSVHSLLPLAFVKFD